MDVNVILLIVGALIVVGIVAWQVWERLKSAQTAAPLRVAPTLVPAAQVPIVPPALMPKAVPNQGLNSPSLVPAAGTVTLPATGHVLPLPRSWDVYPDGESFASYALRVYKECAATDAQAAGTGDLVAGGNTEYYFRNFGGYQKDGSNWPQAVDAYYNPAPYLTPDERDYAAALLARDQAAAGKMFNGPIDVTSLSSDDKMYLFWAGSHIERDVQYKVLRGTSLQIRQAMSEIGNEHTAEAAVYDPSGYSGPLKAAIAAILEAG